MLSPFYADVSTNNVAINLATYTSYNHGIIAIKATEGTFYVDPDYRGWVNEMHRYQGAVIHYHFARPDMGSNPEREADFFLQYALPQTGGRDYLMLDLERGTPEGWAHDPQWSYDFALHVSAKSRFHVILYATQSTLAGSTEWLPAWSRRVIDASWGTTPDYAPEGYECVARQFTNGVVGPEPHVLPGVGVCDVNRMGLAFYDQVRVNSAPQYR